MENATNASTLSDPVSYKRETDLEDGTVYCLDVLRSTGAISWGNRKRVSYVQRKVQEMKPRMSLRGESVSESKAGGSSKQGTSEIEVERQKSKRLRADKRKRECSSYEGKPKVIMTRWSDGRLEAAKKALQNVVTEMDATWHKPVLRHDLREKARKHIGDTGLLDHLLKHMAGKVFADGKDRLVRRHNTEGAIEYWLEPAELAKLRREAGIADPYWVPPPGWKLGDAISDRMCDGRCKDMVSQCKEEINLLKSAIAVLKSPKQTEESHQDQMKLQLQELKLIKEDYQDTLKKHGELLEQVISIKVDYQDILKKHGEVLEQVISIKEEVSVLKENKKRRKEVLDMAATDTIIADCSGEKHLMKDKEKGKQVVAGDEVGTKEKTMRKSGLTICQPEGTFLGPKMANMSGCCPRSMSPDMSLPPQIIALPSPKSPLPPRPAFFCTQQPDNQRRNHSTSQPQAQTVLSLALNAGMINRPTPRKPSKGMTNLGINDRVDSKALASAMQPRMNSDKSTEEISTDLTLASFKY